MLRAASSKAATPGTRAPARPRVVVVDHCAQLSGAELALVRLLPHVPDVDLTVVLAEDGPLVDRLRRAGVDVRVLPLAPRTAELRRAELRRGRIPLRAAADVLGYSWRLARLLRSLRADVVHTNSNKAHLYGGLAAKLAGKPQLWHARDRVARPYMPRAALALSRLAAWTLPSYVLANSRSTLATVTRTGRGAKPALVLAEPVTLPALVARDGRPRPVTVGMVGRLTPWKGQDVFLRAFAEAFPFGDARAVLVGSAMFGEHDYAEELRALAEELGIGDRVGFTDFTDDVDGELARMDALVHASVIPEPFGQVVIEGMAAGLPVIAADAGGPAEIIDDGVTGLLYEPGNVTELAKVLRRVTGDAGLRAEIGRRARAAAAAYDPAAIAARLRAVYAEVSRG